MEKKKSISYLQLIYLAAGALFLFFTGGLYNYWFMAWFPGVFFLKFARNQKTFKGYILIVAVSWVVIIFSWYGIQPAGGLFHVINMLVIALFSTLPVLADRVLSKRVPTFARTLVYPIFTTALEFGFITGNPMGSFGSLAYTQYSNLPLIQIVSLTGLMSITFIISWFASVINEVWESKWKVGSVRGVVLAFVLTLSFVYAYGGLRLLKSRSAPINSPVSISMIIRSKGDTSLRDIMSKKDEDRYTFADSVFENFLAHSLSEKEADIISWPEGAVVTKKAQFTEKDKILKEFSRTGNIYLVAPFIVIPEEGPYENIVVLYTPDGESAFTHTKYGGNIFEGSVPGDGSLKFVDSPFGRLSALICWDMDFPEPVQQAGKNDIDILFSPSSEWREIVPVHAQMVVYRGIENGVSTVHPASLGLSIIADPYGREIATSNWYTDSDTSVRGTVSSRGVKTIYSSIGDIFPAVIIFCALFIIGYMIARKLINYKRV